MLKQNFASQCQNYFDSYRKSYNTALFASPIKSQMVQPNYASVNYRQACLSPQAQLDSPDFSVKGVGSPDEKISLDKMAQYKLLQKNLTSKFLQSPPNCRTSYSDLMTAASISSKSNESFLSGSSSSKTFSNNINMNLAGSENFAYCHRRLFSGNNFPVVGEDCMNMPNFFHGFKHSSVICPNLESLQKNRFDELAKPSSAVVYEKTKSQKSGSGKNVGVTKKNKNKNNFNKFNSPKENTTNENTVILTLKIKVAKNDYRTFNLKKYDDLFISLKKFFDLNQIKQELVKPIITKIFSALNKIFWLLNNKIGIYDQEYLNSLYKLWTKNKDTIPVAKSRNHEASDKSTSSSSESEDFTHQRMKSNSFSEDIKEEGERVNTAKSI